MNIRHGGVWDEHLPFSDSGWSIRHGGVWVSVQAAQLLVVNEFSAEHIQKNTRSSHWERATQSTQ